MFMLLLTYQKYTIKYHFWNKIYIPKKYPKHTKLEVAKTYFCHTFKKYFFWCVEDTQNKPKTYQEHV